MAREVPFPFVRWAGGKSRMTRHILPHIPMKINRYFEPFLGGGALFFELSRQRRFRRASLGDMNLELMNAYNMVRDNVDELIDELSNCSVYTYDKKSYLGMRSIDHSTLSALKRAARFIYLNKTCFNGLFRVNSKGQFNVPFGDYKDPVICDQENLKAVSKALKNVRLIEKSFEWVEKEAKPGDVVYLDPPYLPISSTSNFTKYTESGFGVEQHARLSITFSRLADRGVCTILSNSSSKEVRRLYRDFDIIELTGSRNIGGPAEYRRPVSELMIVANSHNPKYDSIVLGSTC